MGDSVLHRCLELRAIAERYDREEAERVPSETPAPDTKGVCESIVCIFAVIWGVVFLVPVLTTIVAAGFVLIVLALIFRGEYILRFLREFGEFCFAPTSSS